MLKLTDRFLPQFKKCSDIKSGYILEKTYRIFRCDECNTDFPEINGNIRCNGEAITFCPYCKE